MLKERKKFLFESSLEENDKVKEIIESDMFSFFDKHKNKSKWKLTQLFNRNANKKIDKIFFPVYLVPYIGYFSQRFSSNETVINYFKNITTNSDFKMILVCLLISGLIFCMSYLCVSLQNYLIGKIANPLKIFKKKEKIIKKLFDEQPISLNLLKEISKKIGEQKTSEILSLHNGVISNSNIKDILNDNFEDVEDVEEKFKQISSCFFIKEEKFEPKEEITIVEYERKETTDEMIERLERELAERGVDVNELLKQREREKEKQMTAYLMEQKEEEKQKREIKVRRKSEKRPKHKGRKDLIFVLEGIIAAHVKQEVEHLKSNKNLDDYDQLVLKNILSLESRGFDYISYSVKKEVEKLNACSNETLSIILGRIGSGEIISRVLNDYEINTICHNVEDDKDKQPLTKIKEEIKQESLTDKLTREKKAELEFLKKKESPDSTDKEILRIVSEMQERGFDYVSYAVQKEIEEINKVNKEISV